MFKRTFVSAMLASLALFSASAMAQPTFNKAFTPPTIAPGSRSELVFTIDNSGAATPADDLAFTDNLPAGTTIADPLRVANTCGGTLSAPAGSGTIELTGGSVAPTDSCTVAVDIDASAVGTFNNVSGDLTSTAGNSGSASASLTGDDARPGFSVAASPLDPGLGGTSTLTFTLDNSANPGSSFNGQFSVNLPSGLVIASPANNNTDCALSSFSADSGTTAINVFGVFLGAGATCQISVDVEAQTFGDFLIRSSNYQSSNGTSGLTAAAISVEADSLNLSKVFVDDPTAPGQTVTLEYRIFNFDRNDAATDISFTDDFDAALSGLAVTGTLPSEPCGPGSSLSGVGTLTLTGGNLPAEGDCVFSVELAVPAGAAPGSYPSTTSSITGTRGGGAISGSAASDTLTVAPVPRLDITSPVGPQSPGDFFSLTFEITNTSASNGASDITFDLEQKALIPGYTAGQATLPAAGFCNGSGSISELNGFPATGLVTLRVSNASLAAGASCSFIVDYTVPLEAPAGSYQSTSSDISATVDATSYSGNGDTAFLDIVAAPSLSHSFLGTPGAGDTTILRYTLTTSENNPASAQGISFTHDLDNVLTGLTAVSLPPGGFCGASAAISGTSLLSVSGAELAPGDNCSFDVEVSIPPGAAPGSYASATSTVTATVDGQPVQSNASDSTLTVAALSVSKSFSNPTYAADSTTMTLTFENISNDPITDISFTEDLNSIVAGLTPVGLPQTDICGAGSQLTLSGNTLVFSDGTLAAGTSCTFDVLLDTAAATLPGNYGSATSTINYQLDGNPATSPPASAVLEISDPLTFSKAFSAGPVAPGDNVTLTYTIENSHPSESLTGLNFTDDLDAAQSGLAATGLPANDICGAGSTLTGTNIITLTGGSVAPQSSCQFSVTVSVPTSGFTSSTINSNSSTLGAVLDGQAISAPPASASLQVLPLDISLTFSNPALAGGTIALAVGLTNLTADPVDSIAGTINLRTEMFGATAASLPADGFCGPNATASSNNGLVTLQNLSLTGNSSCAFALDVGVPAGTSAGDYRTDSSEFTSNGLPVGPASSDILTVVEPTFSADFLPANTAVGGVSTLQFTIDNGPNSVSALSNLAFTANLDAGLTIASPSNLSSTCTNPVLSATAGGTSVTLDSAEVAAATSCVVEVDVHAGSAGSFQATSGLLSSQLGTLAATSATLDVSPLPTFSMAYTPPVVFENTQSALSFTIDNTAAAVAMPALAFSSTLPAPLVIANPANASSTCGGGTLTATAGTDAIELSGANVAAGSSCTISVDVAVSGPGSFPTSSSPLQTGFDPVAAASATLTVNDLPILSKGFADAQIFNGDTTTLTLGIDNTNSPTAVSGIEITDNLPAGMVVAATPNASTDCSGGTLTATAGAASFSYTGGTVPGAGTCSIAVDVEGVTNGDWTNTTEPMNTDSGLSNAASADLTVTTEHTVGGSVTGLATGNSVTLQLNGGQDLSVNANGGYVFPTPLLDGENYTVSVLTQPSGPNQVCTLSNASGTINQADVSNVDVTCVTETYSIGGSVTGLAAGNSVTLQLNGGQDQAIGANGVFSFPTELDDGSNYSVTVLTQPTSPDQTCTVTNGDGTLNGADVTNVMVTCSTETYSIGGNVTGLAAGNSVTLQLNGGQDLSINADGAFTFPTALPDGSNYSVTVLTQPTDPDQTCAISNGDGTLSGADVSNVTVTCSTDTFLVGGNVSGLLNGQSIELQINGGETIEITGNGAFTFPTPLPDGTAYTIVISSQATAQSCTLSGGSGTIDGGDALDLVVSCSHAFPIPTNSWQALLLMILLLGTTGMLMTRTRQ